MKRINLFNTILALAGLFLLSAPTAWAEECQADIDCSGKIDGGDMYILVYEANNSYRNCEACKCDPIYTCPAELIDCSGTCVDPMTNRNYCGSSEGCLDGTTCGDGEICDSGACVLSTPPYLAECGGISVDTNTDENNCGSCGNTCDSYEICIAGSCDAFPPLPYYAPVPKTGQTTVYAAGDDGDLQKGVVWPDPRFTDNYDGTVTDNLTGLTWLKDTNCFGTKSWYSALADSNGLASGSCGLTDGSSAGDWRLPNKSELESLLDISKYNPALPSGHPFSGVLANLFWSNTTSAIIPENAWYVGMGLGSVNTGLKTNCIYVWPVRGGND